MKWLLLILLLPMINALELGLTPDLKGVTFDKEIGSSESSTNTAYVFDTIEYERGTISSNNYWALGNGQAPYGAPRTHDGKIVGLSAFCMSVGTSLPLKVMLNNVEQFSMEIPNVAYTSNTTVLEESSWIDFVEGDIIGVQTGTEVGTWSNCVATVTIAQEIQASLNVSLNATETDPVWTSEKGDYYTKTESDGLYYLLTNPQNYINQTDGDALYYSISNPNNYLNQTDTDLLYSNTTTFLDLTDTPPTYDGYGGKCLIVNATMGLIDFVDCPTGTGGGNPFDQSLNTTDNVTFNTINTSYIQFDNSFGNYDGISPNKLNFYPGGTYGFGVSAGTLDVIGGLFGLAFWVDSTKNYFNMTGTGNFEVEENVSAKYFKGDGSLLTNIPTTDLTNVAYINESNTFTQEQVIQQGTLGNALRINYLGALDLFKFDTSLGYIVLQSQNNLPFFMANDDYTSTIALKDNGDIDLTPSTRATVYGNLTANEITIQGTDIHLSYLNNSRDTYGGTNNFVTGFTTNHTPLFSTVALPAQPFAWYFMRDKHGNGITPTTSADTFTFETDENLNTTILGSGGVNITLAKTGCGILSGTNEYEKGSPAAGNNWASGNGVNWYGVPEACDGEIVAWSAVCSGSFSAQTVSIVKQVDGSTTNTIMETMSLPSANNANYTTTSQSFSAGDKLSIETTSLTGTSGTCTGKLYIKYT